MKTYILSGVLCLAVAVPAGATVLRLELPVDYGADMVLDPAPGDDVRLRGFFFEELAKLKEPNGMYVIVYTKDGQPLYRNAPPKGVDDDPPYFGELEFVRGAMGDPGWTDRTWADVLWHLYEVYDGTSGVYELARDAFFGPPFVWYEDEARTINVELDEHYPDYGAYFVSTDTIGLSSWRVGEGERPEDRDTDRGMLTRCMLHAFRGEWNAYWDHFDCGTVHAAWIAIQNAISGPGEEPGFNDLWHDEQDPVVYERPEYMHLMAYNVPEMATRLPGFFSPECGVDNSIMWARYRGCGYLWWKVFRQDNDFFKNFNYLLLGCYKGSSGGTPTFEMLEFMADLAYNGGPIESLDFAEWFSAQPLFNNDPWCGEICAHVTYRDRVRVFVYERKKGPFGIDFEEPCGGKDVYWNVFNYDGTFRDQELGVTNQGGYAELNMPYYPYEGGDQRIKVEARVNLDGADEWTDWNKVYTASLDGSPDDYEILGVAHDVTDGTIQIVHGPQYHYRPLVRGLFKLPNFDGDAGAGDYSITYISPGKGGESRSLPHVVKKDGGNFAFSGSVVSDSTFTDGDGNGIPDVVEIELAERFKPVMRMHRGNILHPCTVEANLGTGALAEPVISGHVWHRPAHGIEYPEYVDEMKKIFESKVNEWDDDWFVCFGPAEGDVLELVEIVGGG
jgi:hypothetical protein